MYRSHLIPCEWVLIVPQQQVLYIHEFASEHPGEQMGRKRIKTIINQSLPAYY
jgi:hypothetical protein